METGLRGERNIDLAALKKKKIIDRAGKFVRKKKNLVSPLNGPPIRHFAIKRGKLCYSPREEKRGEHTILNPGEVVDRKKNRV